MKSLITFLGGAAIWAGVHLAGLPFLPPAIHAGIEVAAGAAAVLGARGAITPANAAQTAAVLGVLGAGWKTALGALLAVVTFFLSPDVVGMLSPMLVQILTVVAALLMALGITHAAATNAAPFAGVAARR